MESKKKPRKKSTNKKDSSWKKFVSRKFIVWVTATAFLAVTVYMNKIDPSNRLAEVFISYWGWISLAYIGGNVAKEYVHRKEV